MGRFSQPLCGLSRCASCWHQAAQHFSSLLLQAVPSGSSNAALHVLDKHGILVATSMPVNLKSSMPVLGSRFCTQVYSKQANVCVCRISAGQTKDDTVLQLQTVMMMQMYCSLCTGWADAWTVLFCQQLYIVMISSLFQLFT